MRKLINAVFLISAVSACSTHNYGYTKDEWDSLSPEQKQEAKAKIKKLRDMQHEEDLRNKKIDDLFGTRSNQF